VRRGMIVAGAALVALAACATQHQAQRARLYSSMTGVQEVPGPGDPNTTGTVELRVDARAGQVCWNLNVRGNDPATAAHIHRGAAGVAGPPVVTLTTPDANGHSEGCAQVEQPLAAQLIFRPFDFYVNVHTARFPNGIARGQLRNDGPLRERDRGRDY